jgi:hypothetical protein
MEWIEREVSPMIRDLLTMTGASLAAALVAWIVWGNPEEHSSLHAQPAQLARADTLK